MKRKLTYKKWPCICLLLMFLIQYAQAQYPIYLPQYPVVYGPVVYRPTGIPSGISALAQKGNVVYLGGDFTKLGGMTLSNALVYNQTGDAKPAENFAFPGGAVSAAIPDGAGGFYIKGSFRKVGNAARNGLARINADGTLNNWVPGASIANAGVFGYFPVEAAVKINNTLVIGAGADDSYYLTALDATTGQPVSGWDNLGIADLGFIRKFILNDNKLYILGFNNTDFNQNTLAVLDVTDVNHPSLINSFHLDAQSNSGTELTILDMAVADNILYLTGYQVDGTNFNYQSKTLAGQAFNSSLFAVDATTGTFIKAFATPLTGTDMSSALALDGNKIYLTYHTGTTSKLVAYNTQSGTDLSPDLPVFTMTDSNVPKFLTDGPWFNYNKLTVTADHKLIIYGGFDKINGAPQTMAAIDLTSGSLLDWHPVTVQAGGDNATPSPLTIAESSGKIYVGGFIRLNSPGSTRDGFAAMNASTGEILPWTPADFTGAIQSMAISNNTLYVGGNFTGNKNNLVAYDITDPVNPVLKKDWAPEPDGVVNALLVNGSKLYAGGDFQNMSGQAQNRLAEFDINSGTGVLNTSWNPGPDVAINALTVLDNILYAGGSFKNIGAVARESVAAFDLSASNALTAWNPKLSDQYTNPHNVNALAVQPAEGNNHAARVFIGGDYYNRVGDDAATIPSGFAVVNTTDGALDPWQPAISGFGQGGAIIRALTISGNKLFIGGDNFFNSADVSGNFAQVDQINYLNGAANPTRIGNNIYSILPSANLLFVAGSFGGLNQPALDNPSLIGFAAFQTGQLQGQLAFADFSKTYGDADATPVAKSNNNGLPITYALSEQKDAAGHAATIAEITTDGKLHILKPGTAKITASQAGNADFTTPVDVAAILTINKAELTIRPKDTGSVVNQPLPDFSFTLTGWKLDDESKPGIYSGKPAFTTTATASSPVGIYPITVSGVATLVSDFYSFVASPDQATLTVTTTGSTPQIITFPAITPRTYGDADLALNGTTDAGGITVSYTSTNPAVAIITGSALHITGAGTVTITASQSGNAMYAPAANVQQTLTVAKAALTITADDKTKNRGDANPAFTATYTGLVNGDRADDLATAPVFGTTASTASAPGTYPIMVNDAVSDNYTIAYINGTLTIKGTQIITWSPVSTLTYGDTPFNPGAVSGAGGNVAPVYTTNDPSVISISGGQAVIKGAGTAIITATFAAGNGYEVTTATLPVTVLKKKLVIKADDKSRNYREVNPVFTFAYTGFAGADTEETPGALSTEAIAVTTATTASAAGNYPITASGATSNNYAITFHSGTLTINNLTRALTFNTITAKTYGDADFTGASLNSGEQVVYTFSDPSVATGIDDKIHIMGAGTTTITASAPANTNYNALSPVTQILTVNKAPLMITADNKTKTAGPPDMTLTASYQGFIGTDNQLTLAARPVLTTTAMTHSPAGTYPITISGAASANYDISYTSGTLTIVPGTDAGENSMDAWCSSPSTLEVKVSVASAQRAVIQLFSMSGQRMISVEKQLVAGLNQYQLNAGNLPAGVYALRIAGTAFTLKQHVKIK